jgi:hypothetical protein
MKRLIVSGLLAWMITILVAGNLLAMQPARRGVEPESLAYNGRVYADSGTVTNGQFANWTYRMAKENGILYSPTLPGVTMNISAPSGGPFFVSNPSLNLAPYANSGTLITLTDTAGKVLTFYAGAAGTGETYGANLAQNGTFDSDTIWNKVGNASISGGTMNLNSGGSVWEYLSGYSQGAGQLMLMSGDITYTSGYGSWYQYIYQSIATIFYAVGQTDLLLMGPTSGHFTAYKTTVHATSTTVQVGSVGTTVGTLDNYVIRKVLTPAPTGVWMTQANGTPGYVSMDSEFNLNSATYTVTVAGSQINSGVHAWASEFAGKFDGSGYTSKLYDLAPIGPTDMAQTTGAYQPQKQAAYQNGKSVIITDGSNDYMSFTPPQPPLTVIAGMKAVTRVASTGFVSMAPATGYDYLVGVLLSPDNADNKLDFYSKNRLTQKTSGGALTTFFISSFVATPAYQQLWFNGASIGSDNTGVTFSTLTQGVIGALYSPAPTIVGYSNTAYGFLLVANSDISASRAAIESYFNTAYGVY